MFVYFSGIQTIYSRYRNKYMFYSKCEWVSFKYCKFLAFKSKLVIVSDFFFDKFICLFVNLILFSGNHKNDLLEDRGHFSNASKRINYSEEFFQKEYETIKFLILKLYV